MQGSEPDYRLIDELDTAGYDARMEMLSGADHFGGIDIRQAADQTIAFIHALPGFER